MTNTAEHERARCEHCDDVIELSPGNTIELRHLGPDDSAGLADLYSRLAPEDVYRRFFTASAPNARWFETWANIADRGGFGLVVVHNSAGVRQIVAEAGYAPLCDGDGELGIAVDPKSRGWLGPWLLDALLRHADARGIPNIQALILADNRRMATLAAARGAATIGSGDWSTTRVSMSTTGRIPSWPGDPTGDHPHERKRLLVESDRSRWPGAAEATTAGFDVMVCRGPDNLAHGCPLLKGDSCPLRSGADVVINVLDPNSPASSELLLGERVAHPCHRTINGFVADRATGAVKRRTDSELITDALEAANDLTGTDQAAAATPEG